MAKTQRPRPPAHTESRPVHTRAWKGWTHLLGDRRILIGAILLVGILAAVTRLVNLGADPPTDVSWSQDRLTDPPQYTSYARTAATGHGWNPLGDEKLIFFRKNITGVVAYLVFLIFGPSITTANLTAVLFNLAAVGFLAWGTGRAFGTLAGLGAGWVLALNYLFASYGRQPFLEVASNASLAFAFWGIISSTRRRWWWALAAGLVAGVGTFFGKVTALHVFPVFTIALTLMAIRDTGEMRSAWQRWRGAISFVAGFGLIGLAWYVFAYMTASDAVLAYLKEQSRSLYGDPIGLSSLSGFMRQFFSFGIDNQLLGWSPVSAAVGIIGLAAMMIHMANQSRGKSWIRQINPEVVLVVGWFLSAYLAFMPFNYRPVRYQVVTWLPLAAGCGWLLQRLVAERKSPTLQSPTKLSWGVLPFVFAVVAIGLQHFVFARWLDPTGRGLSTSSHTASIILGLLISVAWLYLASRPGKTGTRRFPAVGEMLVIIFLFIVLATQGRHFVRWWSAPSYSIAQANEDLPKVIGNGAIVTGEWAPPLTQLASSPLSWTHFFSLAEPRTFFADKPITHVIVEDKPDGPWFKDFPELSRNSAKVTDYTIRHLRIGVWRVAELGGNDQAQAYQPTFFERLRAEVGRRPIDSLLSDLDQRVADSANHYSGWVFAADLYRRATRNTEALGCYRHAIEFYPDDFALLAQTGDLSWEQYRTVGGPQERDEALRCWSRALELSPGNRGLMDRLRQAGQP